MRYLPYSTGWPTFYHKSVPQVKFHLLALTRLMSFPHSPRAIPLKIAPGAAWHTRIVVPAKSLPCTSIRGGAPNWERGRPHPHPRCRQRPPPFSASTVSVATGMADYHVDRLHVPSSFPPTTRHPREDCPRPRSGSGDPHWESTSLAPWSPARSLPRTMMRGAGMTIRGPRFHPRWRGPQPPCHSERPPNVILNEVRNLAGVSASRNQPRSM